MTKLEKIEREIESLEPKEMRALAEWFADLRARLWDQQIESDLAAGKLNALIAEAKADIAAGRVKPL